MMDLELLKFLAARNVCDGKLYEPRIYSQVFDFSQSGTLSPLYSDEDVFRNGEQYPVRISHIVAMIRDDGGASGGSVDERLIQRYRFRARMLDTFYMNDEPIPMPLLHNQVCAASDIVTRGTSSWRFNHPFFMGGRDTLSVGVSLEYAVNAQTEGTIKIWVSFHGFGALSRRPKELHGYVTFVPTSPNVLTIPDGFFRNDGTEPLEIHSMSINVEPPTGSAGLTNPSGNIRRALVRVQQVGNGTNQRWTRSTFTTTNVVPAGLWGLTTGRAMVHALPFAADNQRGWIWEPNQGLQLEITGPDQAPDLSQLYVAMVGELIVR